MDTTTTITRREMMQLQNSLEALGRAGGLSIRLNYARVKTQRLLAAEVEALRASAAPLPEIVEYQKRHAALCKDHAAKDGDGRPVTVVQNGVVYYPRMHDPALFEVAAEALRSEYANTIEIQEARNKEIELLLSEQVTVGVHKVALADCGESMDAAIFEGLWPMIEEGA